MSAAIVSFWYRRSLAAVLLFPLSLIFRALVGARAAAYRLGVLPVVRLPVAVVVVGNITVGGAGKTPLVLWLARTLSERGRRVAIISRGYGGKAQGLRKVRCDDAATLVGDEPLLLARRSGCPVWIGRDRIAVVRALLADFPECDVVIADDGLQHYRLARDVELAILDERGVGNGYMLPAGPLREPVTRLRGVDALVANGSAPIALAAFATDRPRFAMKLVGSRFFALNDSSLCRGADGFAGSRLHAVAGIGHPQRFFDHLQALGLTTREHAFPDHHQYRREDFAFAEQGDVILMTEKDAVKCAAFAPKDTWVLPVDADVVPDLAAFILEKLNGLPAA